MTNAVTNSDSVRAVWQARELGTETWLGKLRRDALQAFAASGLPTTRLEDWKYTDVRKIAEHLPAWLETSPGAEQTAVPALEIDNAVHIVFVDGRYAPALSSEKLPAGLYVGDLHDIEGTDADWLSDRLGTLAGNEDSGFVAINTAFAGQGMALRIPDGTTIEQPIYVSYHSTTSQIVVQPRLIVELGENSQATLIEHFTGTAPAIVNTVAEVHCNASSHLDWHRVQDEHADTWHTAVQYVQLERAAILHSTQIDIGAALTRNELRLTLAGSGAEAEAKGLFLADGKQHADSRITVEHAAPNTLSRERYRGILADSARGVFNGRILVQPEAQKTLAELTNRNLLLNPGAEIDTKPELEIYADDVKCAHGSTTGQLDATSMFYLLARGIEPEEARNILVRAFAGELLTDIRFPAIRDRVQSAMEQLGSNTRGADE